MKKSFLLIAGLVCLLKVYSQQTKDNILAMDLIVKNQEKLGLSGEELKNIIIKNSYFNRLPGTQMVYIQQSYLGLPVFNQLQVVAFKDGLPVSVAGGLNRKIPSLAGPGIALSTPAEAAVLTALQSKGLQPLGQMDGKLINNKLDYGTLGVCSETVTAELMWLPLHDGRKVHLVWEIRVAPASGPDYFMIRVDARENRVVDENNLNISCNWDAPADTDARHDHPLSETQAVNHNHQAEESPSSPNLISQANYRVIPFPAESPIHPGGNPSLVTNPWSLAPGNATTAGWHNDGRIDYTITRGNNVYSQEDRDSNNVTFGQSAVSSTLTDTLNFNFAPDFSQEPITSNNQKFAITNLFYWNNIAHDLTYIHGFDEAAGNFQQSNFGRGGLASDGVIADCQDNKDLNNANFATPPDGGRPRMQMYLWSGTPKKDASLDNGVVTHEFGHGISNRLTGGPANTSCLANAEQMGEGWSDYFGLMYTQDWASSNLNTGFSNPRSVATYAANQSITGPGIRTQRYCTNFAINNKVYATSLSSSQHTRGELWCVTLWDMTWNIINQTGIINPSLFDTNSQGGNLIALRLVIEGMKLQPCSPGFISARDAILKADTLLYGGRFNCAIREAFRRRGMGLLASQGSSSSITDQVPDFTGNVEIKLIQGGVSQVLEGELINYTIRVTSRCEAISNLVLRDTLPASVTYVSGGTYNTNTRVVSFPVNMPAGSTASYSFTVRVNNGTYFPTSTPLDETVSNNAIPANWSIFAAQPSEAWTISNLASKSAPYSFYCPNVVDSADQRLTTPAVSLPAATLPRLIFWHKFNTEADSDGGVVEVSTNNGTSWSDLGTRMEENEYNKKLATTSTNILNGRPAFTGTINNFQRTTVDLSSFAGSDVRFRFRFGSDVNTSAPSDPAGWFVDDIKVEVASIVRMRASIFTTGNVKLASSDTITYIVQIPPCQAARVTTQPANLNACFGNNAVFTAITEGTSNSHQWQVSINGGNTFTNLLNDTLPTLTVNNVNNSFNNYQYRLLVSNACPSADTSEPVTLTVSQPVAISAQPTPTQTLCAGQDLNLSAAASGDITGYQWQVSTNGGSSFTDIPGATGISFNINGVDSLLNGNIYRLKIGSCNNITSGNSVLTVLNPPSIQAAPQSVTVCTGNTHTFSVAAGGSGLTYQWQLSTNNGASFSDIQGAVSSNYFVPAVNSSLDGNQYRVVISGSCPSPVTSAPATLLVGAALNITDQPDDVTACAGTDITISLGATGAVGYQWQVSTNGGANFTNIAGASGATLNLASVTSTQQGNIYRVVISSCSGNVNSAPATLSVINPVNLTAQPADKSVCIGSNTSLSVTAAGTGITYQWQMSENGGNSYSDISGANASSINLTSVNFSINNNLYRVVITPATPCTSVTSNAALITVNVLPEVTAIVSPADTICEGTQITLSGSGADTYTWNRGVIDNTPFIPQSSGPYIVTGTDANGCFDTETIQIYLNPLPSVSITADPFTSLLPEDSTTLTATANPASVSFSWYKDNTIITGATSPSITVRASETGSYKVIATSVEGCSKASNIIDIRDSIRPDVFIYPNPNSGEFRVSLPASNTNGSWMVTVYDSKGARVYSQTRAFTNREARMNLRHLASGVYLLRVWETNGKEIRTGKVAILR